MASLNQFINRFSSLPQGLVSGDKKLRKSPSLSTILAVGYQIPEQLIERPGSLQPTPDRFQFNTLPIRVGVIITFNEVFAVETPVESTVTTPAPDVVIESM